MKKRVVCFVLCVVTLFVLVGCHASVAYTFTVSTGDKIKVQMNVTDDWKLEEEDGQFTVKNNDETIIQGLFGTMDDYDSLYEAVNTDSAVLSSKESERNGNTYVFYEYDGENGKENDILLKVKDSSTCVIMGSQADKSLVEEAFDKLKFSKE